MYNSNRDKHISNKVGSISVVELLYVLDKPSYKLEKILEITVIMNWLIDKTDAGCITLLESEGEQFACSRETRKYIQKHHPVFYIAIKISLIIV